MSNQIVISSGAKVRSLNGVITGTTGVLDSLPINASNGIPQLDVNGKILVSQLPNSVMEYQGTWNANTNTPTLTNGGAFNQGDVYLCNVAGTTDFGAGPIAFVVGDQVIYSGSIWQRASGASGTVTSVAVTESGDALTITGSPITTSGTINIGFAGISSQYVAGNGALVTFPTLTGYVPYTGATQDVDLGAFKLNAQSLHAKGTAGLGHLGLKHQSASATASANEASLFADSLGDLSWQNGNIYLSKFITSSNTAARSYTFPNANGTVALTSDISYPVTSVFGRTGAVVATEGDYSLTQLSDVTITSPSNGQVLKYNGTLWINDTDANSGTVTSVAALTLGTTGTDLSSTVANGTTTPVITLNVPTASATNRGALSSADWSTFNNKQSTLSLTTTGNSGSATLVSNTLNVPTYTLAGLGGISLTSLSATTPLSYNNTTGAFSIQVANTSQDGYLSSTDWNTFNNKQSTITNPVTGTGTSGQVTYFNGTSSVTSSSNFKFDGTNLTIGNPSSALAQLHVYNASAAASFLLQTNSTTDYSEIAVRNNSSTATSYFRQYSTAATGSDFGISRAGLAMFFSNYATNFAIGTRNGGDLILGTNDTERVRVLSSNGNVGINTSTPGRQLEIYNANDAYMKFNGVRAGNHAFTVGNDSAGFIVYDETSAAYRLIISNSTGAATFSSSVTANYGGTFIIPSESPASGNVALTAKTSNGNNDIFRWYDGTTQLGVFKNNGNVGIGTSSPQSILHAVKSNSTAPTSGTTPSGYALSYGAGDGNNGGLWFSTDFGGDQGISGIAGTRVSGYETDLRFYTNNTNAARAFTERMRITSAGNVGISTSSPSTTLHVLGPIRSQDSRGGSFAAVEISGGSSSSYPYISVDQSNPLTFITGAAERMRITSGGSVCIGRSSSPASAYKLAVQEAVMMAVSTNGNNMVNFFNQSDGYVASIVVNASTVIYGVGSDYRLKEDYKEFNGLDKVLAIKTYDFKYKLDNSRMEGVIAHELQEIVPYAVSGKKDEIDNDGNNKIQNVDYSKLVPILVKAIQEQQAQIEELKLKIK